VDADVHHRPGTKALRRTVLFSGQVQGVGFRYTARNVALQYDVRGYVRNLPDGRVELAVEGDAREIDSFVQALKEKMGSFIRRADVNDSPATGEFNDFSIRH
jgi:acylphosphatase